MEQTTNTPQGPFSNGCILCTTITPIIGRLWSQATGDHFKNAGVEFLKGIKCLIDLQISMLNKGAAESKGTHVTID